MMKHQLLVIALSVALPCVAQDAKTWLEKENLDALETRNVEDLEIVVARNKGAKNPKDGEDRVVIFGPKAKQPLWQSNPKETEPGSRWKLHAIGRDLDGDGHPDLHASTFSGGPRQSCCTAHHVLRLKPQVKRLAAYSAPRS